MGFQINQQPRQGRHGPVELCRLGMRDVGEQPLRPALNMAAEENDIGDVIIRSATDQCRHDLKQKRDVIFRLEKPLGAHQPQRVQISAHIRQRAA